MRTIIVKKIYHHQAVSLILALNLFTGQTMDRQKINVDSRGKTTGKSSYMLMLVSGISVTHLAKFTLANMPNESFKKQVSHYQIQLI